MPCYINFLSDACKLLNDRKNCYAQCGEPVDADLTAAMGALDTMITKLRTYLVKTYSETEIIHAMGLEYTAPETNE